MYNNLLAVTLGTGSKNRLFYHLHTQFISMLVRIAVLNSLASKNDDTAGQLDMEEGGVKMGREKGLESVNSYVRHWKSEKERCGRWFNRGNLKAVYVNILFS